MTIKSRDLTRVKKINKYPETLPDLEMFETVSDFGIGYLINTPEKWCLYRHGSNYLEICLEGDSIETGKPKRYFIEFELKGDPRDFHYGLSNQEKDQIHLLFLNVKGLTELC